MCVMSRGALACVCRFQHFSFLSLSLSLSFSLCRYSVHVFIYFLSLHVFLQVFICLSCFHFISICFSTLSLSLYQFLKTITVVAAHARNVMTTCKSTWHSRRRMRDIRDVVVNRTWSQQRTNGISAEPPPERGLALYIYIKTPETCF